jgi:hypothetical protein
MGACIARASILAGDIGALSLAGTLFISCDEHQTQDADDRYLRRGDVSNRRRAVSADCTGYAPVGRIVTVHRTAEKGGIGGAIPAGTVLEPIGSPLVPTLAGRPSEEQRSPVSPRAFGKGRKIPPVTRDGISGHFSGVGREIHAVISRYANSSISGSRRKMLKSRMSRAEIVASTRG